jgi:hypothetical protein
MAEKKMTQAQRKAYNKKNTEVRKAFKLLQEKKIDYNAYTKIVQSR